MWITNQSFAGSQFFNGTVKAGLALTSDKFIAGGLEKTLLVCDAVERRELQRFYIVHDVVGIALAEASQQEPLDQ